MVAPVITPLIKPMGLAAKSIRFGWFGGSGHPQRIISIRVSRHPYFRHVRPTALELAAPQHPALVTNVPSVRRSFWILRRFAAIGVFRRAYRRIVSESAAATVITYRIGTGQVRDRGLGKGGRADLPFVALKIIKAAR